MDSWRKGKVLMHTYATFDVIKPSQHYAVRLTVSRNFYRLKPSCHKHDKEKCFQRGTE